MTPPQDPRGRPLNLVYPEQTQWFFNVLSKTTHPRLRSFYHKEDSRKKGDKGKKDWWSNELALQCQLEERAVYIVIGDGGDEDASIVSQPATFGEWDNVSRAEQASFDWAAHNLPRPTMANWSSETEKTSLHFFFVYTEPVTDIWRWRLLQWRLIRLVQSDPSIENPSRVMRVPGYKYAHPAEARGWVSIDPSISSGQKVHFAELENRIWQAEQQRGWDVAGAVPGGMWKRFGDELRTRFGLEQPIEPKPVQQAAPTPSPAPSPTAKPSLAGAPPEPSSTYAPATLDDIREALSHIPPRGSVPGTYKTRDRNILWGLAAALEAIGRPREEAAALVEAAGWKDWEPMQILGTGGQYINESTFWFHARENGFRPARQFRVPTGIAPPEPQAVPSIFLEQRLREAIDLPETEVALLIADFSKEVGVHAIELKKILEGLKGREQARFEIEQEVQAIEARQHQSKLSELITLGYLFPAIVANALKTRTRYLPSDPVSIAIPYLTGQSSLLKLGTRLLAVSVSGMEVPLNLFSVLVAQSGGKKSPLKRAVIDEPLKELQEQAMAGNERRLLNWKHENEGVKDKDKTAKPAPAYVHVSKVTPEVLAQQMMYQEVAGLGMLLMRDEFSGLIGSIDQYKQSGKGDGMQQFLELFEGDGDISLFKTIDNVHFKASHLSIYSNSQKKVIAQYMKSGDEKGMWARFCMAPLPAVIIEMPPVDDPEEERELEVARRVLRDVSKTIYTMPKRIMRFAPDARALFSRYEAQQYKLTVANDDSIGSLHGKSAGKVARIAGILHCIEMAASILETGEPGRPPLQIPLADLDKAINLVNHMNAWMISLVKEDGDEASGAGILNKVLAIAKRKAQPVAYRDILMSWQKASRSSINKQIITEVFEALAKSGQGSIDGDGKFSA